MKARVGFEVVWLLPWPEIPGVVAVAGQRVTIFPRTEVPADHPVVLQHREYFR